MHENSAPPPGAEPETAAAADAVDPVGRAEPAPDPDVADPGAPGGVDLKVTVPALAAVIAIVAWGLLDQDSFAATTGAALDWILEHLGWLFATIATALVIFVIALGFSRYGAIRLGGDDERPEFSTPAWIAMMFAAGMGIGLLFYGAYEPLNHYRNPPPGVEGPSVSASFAHALLHWTLHPWSMYAIVGLAIAYGTFRLGRPQLISAAFIPLIGARRAAGPIGRAIDVLAVFSTVFGTAASLAVGATQIGAGMEFTGLVGSAGTGLFVIVVLVLGVAYLASAMSGVGRGIRWLSNINMALAAVLALFVLLAGPTVAALDALPVAVGSYLDQLPRMAFRTAANQDGGAGEWLSTWTLFWWAWWISWSPFVGMFLARISRGRTIREFLAGVILVPSVVSAAWFAIFGGAAIHLEDLGRRIWGDGTPEFILFRLLDQLPAAALASGVAMVLLGTFFITSADSASTVMATMSQYGRTNPSPWLSAVWGSMTGLVAILFLVTGGEDTLTALQTILIVAGSPFLLVAAALAVSVAAGVARDPLYLDERERRRFALRLARERRLTRDQAAAIG
ncbi:BCCT family transporter [Corynebacterium sphenisci]|uniref:BCCT family transporter n=1 Tax=Corynebacterium sphenisci TaxID=191493 RepID=UPI0026E0AE14|nr:BCCT family transporter [Corynebacterium sphenisci]MDO5732089.1 BCCT family transporter [Corynebacterium sphenisci]